MMRRALFTLLAAAAPRAVLACPVCFGQSDSPMAAGMNLGVFAMIGVTGTVLAAFGSFFIYLMRRARLAEAEPPVVTAAGTPRAAIAPHAPGGTVSC
jgi:hypothetical protein